MFKKKTSPPTKLEEAIDEAFDDLRSRDTASEEYAQIVEQIAKLTALVPEKPKKVSKETWAQIGGNLLGIHSILWFEKANVMTSKALGFVTKTKL